MTTWVSRTGGTRPRSGRDRGGGPAAELPERRAFHYTYTAAEGKMAFLEWAYEDAHVTVSDGADSYLIEDGKIVAQTIHYTIEVKNQGE